MLLCILPLWAVWCLLGWSRDDDDVLCRHGGRLVRIRDLARSVNPANAPRLCTMDCIVAECVAVYGVVVEVLLCVNIPL